MLQVKSLADQLSIAGKPIDDDDLISATIKKIMICGSSTFLANSRPTCQICGKQGYQALLCFHMMDFAY